MNKNNGRAAWFDLLTSDVDAARDFYSHVFGWTTEPFGDGDKPYQIVSAGDTPIGGLMQRSPEMERDGQPVIWWAHVVTDDVDCRAARAVELGGSILTAGTDIPEVGRFAIVADVEGARVSLFAPRGEREPVRPMAPGTFVWHELNTSDSERALAFYAELFDWEQSELMDMGEHGTYRMFHHPDDGADRPMGGMYSGPNGMDAGSNWLYYVNVDDITSTLERVKEAGGQLCNPPMDVPGGKTAICQDPQGAVFGVFAEG